MGRIEFAHEYEVDADLIWMVISDFSQVHNISFQVASTKLLSDYKQGLGAERLCTRYDKYTSQERVVEWDENSKSYRVDIVGGTVPFDNASFRVKVTPHAEDEDRCFVSGDFEYTVKWGFIGQLVDRWYLRNTLELVFELYLAGVEYNLKTGKDVPSDFTIEMVDDVE